jgi:ABC-type glycerol-3-phosphate transport system substrate-binding protein
MPKNAQNAGTTGGWTVSLAKESTRKDSAMRFLKWLASPEGSLIWSDTQGAMPIRESAFMDKINEADGAYKMKWEASLENLKNAQSVDLTKFGASYDASVKIMNATVNLALIGDVSPQQALDYAKEELEELLEKDGFLE